MPNHYTTVALCTPGYDFNCQSFNDQDYDLCAVVMPRPEELQGIQSGFTTINGELVTAWREADEEAIKVDSNALKAKYGHDNWYDWSIDNWGTKWGTYNAEAFDFGGDGDVIAIKFQSAWCAPKILFEIAQWLNEQFGFEDIAFFGNEPYDGSKSMLDEFSFERKDDDE